MRLAAILLVGVAAVACRPAAAQKPPEPPKVEAERTAVDNFSIVVPEGMVLVRTDPPPPDFDIWTVRRDGVEYAKVYLGNHPSFPGVTLPGPLSPETDNPRTMSAPGPDGTLRPIEFLWRTTCRWPSHIHAFAIGDDSAVSDQAAAIAASVRPGPCTQPELPAQGDS